MKDLIHTGVSHDSNPPGRGSGRYGWGTGENTEQHQPNQDYYVYLMNEMSFSSFLYPENQQEVLDDLERFFKEI